MDNIKYRLKIKKKMDWFLRLMACVVLITKIKLYVPVAVPQKVSRFANLYFMIKKYFRK